MSLRDDFSKFIPLCHTGKGSKKSSFSFVFRFRLAGEDLDCCLLVVRSLIGAGFELLDTLFRKAYFNDKSSDIAPSIVMVA